MALVLLTSFVPIAGTVSLAGPCVFLVRGPSLAIPELTFPMRSISMENRPRRAQ